MVIAHDFCEVYGGAERIAATIAEAFPEAPFYSILGRREVAERMGVADRFHSILPARRPLLRHYRALAPAYPSLTALRRLPEADLLISSSYAFAHGFRTKGRAPHLCYCYSPLRFAWSMTEDYARAVPGGRVGAAAVRTVAGGLRISDRRAAARVDEYVAESGQVRDQISACYGIDAEVIWPPVDCDLFRPAASPPPGDGSGYVLFCGRLIEPYKRPTAAVDAFRDMPDRRLVVAGDGPELARLRARASPNVEFLGHLDDRELVDVMAGCEFAIFPSHDDFGLIPVEVMACGRPVLAYAGGGALETVIPGRTGEFFSDHTAPGIAAAVGRFVPGDYEPGAIRSHAEEFGRDRFVSALRNKALTLAARGRE